MLIRHLPRDAALVRALRGERPTGAWTEHLLAAAVDELATGNWLYASAHTAENADPPERPEPIPRPGRVEDEQAASRRRRRTDRGVLRRPVNHGGQMANHRPISAGAVAGIRTDQPGEVRGDQRPAEAAEKIQGSEAREDQDRGPRIQGEMPAVTRRRGARYCSTDLTPALEGPADRSDTATRKSAAAHPRHPHQRDAATEAGRSAGPERHGGQRAAAIELGSSISANLNKAFAAARTGATNASAAVGRFVTSARGVAGAVGSAVRSLAELAAGYARPRLQTTVADWPDPRHGRRPARGRRRDGRLVRRADRAQPRDGDEPIGLVVAAIMLLVGRLVLAYQRSTTFRGIVNAASRPCARSSPTRSTGW